MSPLMNFVLLPSMFEKTIDFTLSHPNFQILWTEHFDIVIVEVFHSEALIGKFDI